MDGWPYVGGGAFCRPVGCADPFPMPGRDRDFSARRVLAMRAILSPPRKLWNIRRLAVAASGRGSMAHPPRKGRALPLWSHFSAASSKFHPVAPHVPVYDPGACLRRGKEGDCGYARYAPKCRIHKTAFFCCVGGGAPSFPPLFSRFRFPLQSGSVLFFRSAFAPFF